MRRRTRTRMQGTLSRTQADRKGNTMLRHVTIALAAVTLVGASLIPDDASARGGRGAGGARVSSGGARVAANRAHVAHPIARNGAWRAAGGRGNAWRGVGWGVGAAA